MPDEPESPVDGAAPREARTRGSQKPGRSPRRAAMDLLARREHSALELQWKLSRRFPEPDVVQVVQALGDEGLQSDERFAESFARERLLRAYGPRRIRAELQQRGVREDLIGSALARAVAEEQTNWTALAREALRRRFGEQTSREPREQARRQRYLYQRGFSPEDLRGDDLYEGVDPGDTDP